MDRSDMTILTSFLFQTYSSSKVESSDVIDTFTRSFGWMDRDVFSFILRRYVADRNQYFPRVSDIENLIAKMREEQKLVLEDPRNRFYAEVSEEAGQRRRKKLVQASEFLKRTEKGNRLLLK